MDCHIIQIASEIHIFVFIMIYFIFIIYIIMQNMVFSYFLQWRFISHDVKCCFWRFGK